MFRKQESVAELLFIAERYLGRILTPTDMNSILYWYDGLGFSTDLIEYLVEYCDEQRTYQYPLHRKGCPLPGQIITLQL